MGAILQHEVCDARLAELNRLAYADMHDLPGIVSVSMEVAAANRLRETEAELDRVKTKLAKLERAVKGRPWNRICYMCGAPAMCAHREPELVDIWQDS